MDKDYRRLLESQGYKFIGSHSAVKTCHYTASSIRGQEPCYKEKFYGIKSHQCVQMTVAANFCNQDCIFCWRSRNNSAFGRIDKPKALVKAAVEAHKSLVAGFGGRKGADLVKWRESRSPRHFTLSLNGENTAYPKLGKFIYFANTAGYTTFLVSNGMLPEVLKKIPAPTQLYISMSAPNKELFKKVNRPFFKDYWKRYKESLDILKIRRKDTRTAIRMTIIKGITDCHPAQYADLIKRADPMFVEVKSYSWLGASKARLEHSRVMSMDEIRKFARSVASFAGYRPIDEQEVGRVVLLMKADFSGRFLKLQPATE